MVSSCTLGCARKLKHYPDKYSRTCLSPEPSLALVKEGIIPLTFGLEIKKIRIIFDLYHFVKFVHCVHFQTYTETQRITSSISVYSLPFPSI